MHPAHQAFREWLRGKSSAQVGQVWIGVGAAFELRHVLDRDAAADRIQQYDDPWAARELGGVSDAGGYRPLKSAPNLRRGWRLSELDLPSLITALDCFYPGAIAQWHASQTGTLEATTYRACAARQTGMYRITTLLTDEQVERVTACCCRDGECLKSPLWTTLSSDKLPRKPDQLPMPCPEPCSMLLSFARKVARLEQEEIMDVKFTKSDLELIRTVLQSVLDGTAADYRDGDYGDPRHRQRIEYFLKKYEQLLPRAKSAEAEREE